MGNKKETAVDWLVNQFIGGNYSWEVYEQAKEMEKSQIVDAAHNGFECGYDIANELFPEYLSAKDYYKKNYE
jgi:hypothetical protein